MTPCIDNATRLCAVIGDPVEHSLSPAIHNAAFRALGLNYVYLAFHVKDVAAFVSGMRAMPSFRGVSVTIPHKLAVMRHLDEIDPIAAHVGSVNTIINDDGVLRGTTTDGPGTLRAFEEAETPLDGRRVLFLGTGGAVRAVAFAFAAMAAPSRITILGRRRDKAEELALDLSEKCEYSAKAGTLSENLSQALAEHDIIVHGTPVGMYPHEGETLVPSELLRPSHVVFDMVYRPRKTRLILDAEARGCRTILGMEMLVNQAALQFERWTGKSAPLGVMKHTMEQALAREQ